jgi:hypothetical protein
MRRSDDARSRCNSVARSTVSAAVTASTVDAGETANSLVN